MGFLSKRSLLYALCCLFLNLGVARDTISSFQSLKDPDYIISNGSAFRLGFFSPVNSTNRYLGIWYNKISVVNYFSVVWVANRERPLKDSSGVLTIYEDGNLVVLNGQEEILWSSNVSNSVPNSSATLLDSGNLVLQRDTTGAISPSDPSIGRFSSGVIPQNISQGFIWKDGHPYWRTGPWNGQFFTGAQSRVLDYQRGYTLVYDKEEIVCATITYVNGLGLSKHFLDSQGNFTQLRWDDEKEDWEVVGFAPANECDVYGTCGAFGSCYALSSPICSCLKGFEPKIVEEWNRGNWMSGCVRRTPLQRERVNNGSKGAGKADGFLKLEMVKVPDFAKWSYRTKDDCRKQCLENCSCVAYAYDTHIGCMSWSGNLFDLQKFSTGGLDIYIRLSYLEFENERNLKVIIIVTVIIGAMAIPSTTYFLWRWMTEKRVRKNKSRESLPSKNLNNVKLHELPTFSLEELATATNNFHVANMLGRGGFGTVYKGKLHDGQEIAVKRLSRSSGQGLEEFMNEVFVISKLQHRNLAWKLWNDDNIMALVDPTIWDPCFQMEMLRCIHVGLLCVQELARDRPTVSTIISMLNSEILDLPTPKQPAFTERQIASNEEPAQLGQIKSSSCNITITTVYAR
ncbi:hypothetical protein RGQ29_019129 [Quercus rubra]|uniref:non-specific serine/threonine protein kinase n=1 Tax=Quercus rubra TaxID=3512 RepID=A0AAN7F7P6_QUERU|nr:hypothetical protein RGQ29_019129 [Quercus rubra]